LIYPPPNFETIENNTENVNKNVYFLKGKVEKNGFPCQWHPLLHLKNVKKCLANSFSQTGGEKQWSEMELESELFFFG
jgi:hypothetical protein